MPPGNDLNVNIPVGIKSNVAGPLADIRQEFASTRKTVEKPMVVPLDVDTSRLDKAVQKVATARSRVTKSSGGRGARAAGDPLGDINGPVVRPRFSADDQLVRDTMAGLVKGIRDRSNAEIDAAKQTRIETEARKRLGLGSNRGRDVAKEDIPLGDREGPGRRPTLGDEYRYGLRRQEENNRAGNVSDLTAGESNYSTSRFNRLTPQQARERSRALNSPKDRTASGASGSRRGGSGSSGGDSDLHLENKVNLGAGNKVGGDIGLALGGVATAIAITAELGTAMKSYKDHLSAGLGPTDAVMLGFRELGAKLPIIGGVLDGLDNLAAELNGDADKLRGRAKSDQTAADNATINKRKTAVAAAGKSVTDPLIEAVNSAIGGNRVASAGRDDETGRKAQLAQAAVDRDARARDLNKQSDEIRRAGGTTTAGGQGLKQGDAGFIDQNAVESNLARIDKLRVESNNKFDLETSGIRVAAAKEEVAQRKQTEADVFQTRQAYLNKEGQIVEANLEAVDHEAEQAKKAAQDRADQAVKSFGANSDQAKDAQHTLGGQLKEIDDRKNVNRAAIIEQAGRQNAGDLAGGLRLEAALGSWTSAIKASEIVIQQEANAREKTLKGIIADKSASDDAHKEAQRQLDMLPALTERQKDTAGRQILAQDDQRIAGTFADANSGRIAELRRQADRTGNRGLGLQADAYDLAGQSQQRELELKGKLAAGGLQENERDALQQAIDDLPGELAGQIKDLTRSKVSSEDFANGALAQAQEAGGLTGLAANAKENVQARIAKLNEDMSSTLKAILAAVKTGGNTLVPAGNPYP